MASLDNVQLASSFLDIDAPFAGLWSDRSGAFFGGQAARGVRTRLRGRDVDSALSARVGHRSLDNSRAAGVATRRAVAACTRLWVHHLWGSKGRNKHTGSKFEAEVAQKSRPEPVSQASNCGSAAAAPLSPILVNTRALRGGFQPEFGHPPLRTWGPFFRSPS